ncbi:MAG: hypothetical protein AAF415_04070 [Pseudomonadota bacterium]
MAVDHSVGTFGVESGRPAVDDLQTGLGKTCGIAAMGAVMDRCKRKQPAGMRAIPAPLRQNPQRRTSKVIVNRAGFAGG